MDLADCHCFPDNKNAFLTILYFETYRYGESYTYIGYEFENDSTDTTIRLHFPTISGL